MNRRASLEETELAKVKTDGYKLGFLWICVVVRSFPHTEHPTVKVHPPQPDWYEEFYAGAMDKTVITYEAEDEMQLQILKWGHDLDFSLNNQYIASSSLDKTVRVWDIPNGLCIRVIYGVTSQLCIRFHPISVHQYT
ncbi:WD repeat-containing protein 13 [Tanacetum coccineum]